MKRLTCAQRDGWQRLVEADGMIWHTPYWSEGAYYSFTAADVAAIKAATEELYGMFLAAGSHVIEHRLFAQLDVPDFIVPALIKAWEQEPPCLNYGRFDLGYNGDGKPKLFEFNCDTPTSLLEAAIIQWRWKEAVFPKLGQANEIHEWLEWKWKDIVGLLPAGEIFFMAGEGDLGEDIVTATYMAEFVTALGRLAVAIKPDDVGWDARWSQFVGLDELPMRTICKLYPWEWMLREEFGAHVPEADVVWIEPVWKALLSNKAILPVLSQLYPGHPLLLEAWYDPPRGEHIAKPIFGREGRGVRLSSEPARPDPLLGKEIFQQRMHVQPHGGRYPVVGSWCVDGNFAGIGIREGGLITGNTSAFVPHVVEDEA